MYNTLKELYKEKHDKDQIYRATQEPYKWITYEQYLEIVGEDE